MTDRANNLSEPLLGQDSGENFAMEIKDLGEMFHPDNIKNFHGQGGKVAISLYQLLKVHGGAGGVARKLNSHVKNGIVGSDQDIQKRVAKYGSNRKRLPKIRTLCELILENFEDRILQILLMAAFAALIIGVVQHGWAAGWVEGMSIFIAVAIIVSVTAGNNYVKEKQFQKLVSKANEEQIAVYRGRDGSTTTIWNHDLLVGDVIQIQQGMRIPADCILISGTDIAIDESSMTGEPEQIEKQAVTEQNYQYNPNPFLLGNTLVEQGAGVAIVCAVGVNTRSGMAEEKLNIEEDETPLQMKLETIANEIGKVGVFMAIITFIAMSINLVVNTVMDENGNLLSIEVVNKFVNFIIIAITVVVVAVPEGLPLAVTISLAYSVMKMKLENNLVRKLEASETMGGANEICTDKTGTLTQNKMTVKQFYTAEQIYSGRPRDYKTIPSSDLFSKGVLYNCSARVEIDPQTKKLVTKGNCTEQGLINFLIEIGVDVVELLRSKEDRILGVIPFNSARKRASTVVDDPQSKRVHVFLKGAPEIVVDYCTTIVDRDGNNAQLTEEKKQHLLRNIVTETFAKQAFRTLLIAHTSYTREEYEQIKASNNGFHSEKDREVLETNLTVVGIFALADPLRPEIIDSVRQCKTAGINIRMVTGDNIETAKAIAIEAGLVTKEEARQEFVCMEGKQFREHIGGFKVLEDPSNPDGRKREEISNKKAFRDIAAKLKVLARSTPEDKYMLVTGLKDENNVVAVTGDGTNDAPALKKADVGFAMGITGTEVAKEASDIILLDDNFASILTAVRWGRNIYTNVRKFLQFQLTVNCVAMFIVFLGGVVVSDPPLTAVQMLWVNLIMDTCAALALATESPSDTILLEKPYKRTELIVTPVMWRNILGHAFFQAAFLVVMLFFGQQIFDIPYDQNIPFYIDGVGTNKTKHYTLIFHMFVFLQVFNEINARKLGAFEYNVFSGFFTNGLFLGVIIGTVIVQCLLVQYGGIPVRTTPLSMNEHLICVGVGLLSLVNAFFVKALLPVSWFEKLHMKEEAMTDEEEKNAFTSSFRKSFRQSIKKQISQKMHDGAKTQ